MPMQNVYFQPLAKMGRRMRRPVHTFNLRHRPFQIQPFLLAPVLPGETLKNLLLQARVVTDPIQNALIGWWHEYYIFYCKLRDLHDRDDFVEMLLDTSKDMSTWQTAASFPTYHSGTAAVQWSKECLDRVVECYFRDEGESFTAPTIDSVVAARINNDSWIDSVVNGATMEPTGIDVTIQPAGTDAELITASEVDAALRTWQWARQTGLTDQTYEDFLATYGVRMKKEELHEPELIRYIREWQYPSNTVDPSDGTVASAVSWSIAERADKDRFFKEPGFIFGVTVTRPKVYLRNQVGSAAGLMQSAQTWLPAILRDDSQASWVEVGATAGPLDSNTDSYWVDIKDILLHGDQFLNYDPASVTDRNFVDLPAADLDPKWYPDIDDVNALFIDTDDNPGLTRVRQDGVCNLTIAGAQMDQSQRTPIG